MRVTRKVLIPYLIDSITNLSKKEKIYWGSVFVYSAALSIFLGTQIHWSLGILLFCALMLQGQFPLSLNPKKIGQYPMSERQTYQLKQPKPLMFGGVLTKKLTVPTEHNVTKPSGKSVSKNRGPVSGKKPKF